MQGCLDCTSPYSVKCERGGFGGVCSCACHERFVQREAAQPVPSWGLSTARIDSLDHPGLVLRAPISVLLVPCDGEVEASWPETLLTRRGSTTFEAVDRLRKAILSAYFCLRGERVKGRGPRGHPEKLWELLREAIIPTDLTAALAAWEAIPKVTEVSERGGCPESCRYGELADAFEDERTTPRPLVTTRSCRNVDAHRDFDGFDINEELARLRYATTLATPEALDFAKTAFTNIDEFLVRGGPLPRTWEGTILSHEEGAPSGPTPTQVASAKDAGARVAMTLAVDFDGVLHSYTHGWQGLAVIDDPPVPGAIEWLTQAAERFDVVIFSARNAHPPSVNAMRVWFVHHGLPVDVLARLTFPTEKPTAHVYLDDRAWRFEGTFPDLASLGAFTPWNRRPAMGAGD